MLWFLILLLIVCNVRSETDDLLDPVEKNDKKFDPYASHIPVPFGHIFREGIDDLSAGYKVPIDLLELRLVTPRSREESERLLKEANKSRITKIHKPWNIKFQLREDIFDEDFTKDKDKKGHDNEPEWFNFEKIIQNNVNLPRPIPHDTEGQSPIKLNNERIEKFPQTSFDLLPDETGYYMNWTTCDEFVRGIGPKSVLHPADIVNIDWEPFFIWSPARNGVSIPHRFQYPTKKVVKEYKEKFGPYYSKTLDWNQPKLLLKEATEMLLIAGDRVGLFYGIPKHEIPYSVKHKNITLPLVKLRMKIADPYLALMYCDDLYAAIMSTPENSFKTDEEKVEEAAILKFRGEGYPVSRDRELEMMWQEEFKDMEAREKNKTMPEISFEPKEVRANPEIMK